MTNLRGNPGLESIRFQKQPVVLWLLLAGLAASSVIQAADATRPSQKRLALGGIDVTPQLSVAVSNQMMILTWFGFGGPYQIESRTELGGGAWKAQGGPTEELSLAILATAGQNSFFRVSAADPEYVGADTCKLCHRSAHTDWSGTAHANALQSLKNIGQQNNSVCLPCHTVGYGTKNGFKDEATTPKMANVQCENCHGPGGKHASDPMDPSVKPVVELSGYMCGGCHTDAHHPTFDEWQESRHFHVDEHVQEYFKDKNTGTARMVACGPCHSGAVRLAMLNQLADPSKPVALPTGAVAADTPITCATCHNPHVHGVNAQLRNPTYSTNNFSYSTSTNTSFAKQYDPKIQLCGQCHNMRGASWKDTSRPPHHSTQYNILVGQGGYDLGNPRIAAHGRDIQKQCAHCHTHAHEVDSPSEDNPNYTGHTFEPEHHSCIECHDDPEGLVQNTQSSIKRRMSELKALLDQWATTKAPPVLQAKYGALAWEYNTPGQLSDPNGVLGGKGPTNAEQTEIPDGIKQARYNLYLIEHDHSYGIHNGRYSRYLLDVAKTNVNNLLKP